MEGLVEFRQATTDTFPVAPIRSTPRAAGFDISIPISINLEAGERRHVPSGWKVKMPAGTYGRICGRSGELMFRPLF